MSTDGGSVWTQIDSYHRDGGTIVADPNNDSIYWSGGNYRSGIQNLMSVSKTTNSGASWVRYDLTTTEGFTYALAIDPTNSDIVYAGGFPGLYKTTDGGANWLNMSTGINGSVYALAIDPQNPATAFAGTPDGVFKSIDGGKTWSNTGCSEVNAILIDSEHPNMVYAGTSQGVFESTTGGGDWTEINEGLDTLEVTSLGINAAYLFAGTDGKGMYCRGFEIGKTEEKRELWRDLIYFAQPNPTRAKTTIHYVLSQRAYVELTIYGVQGRLVRELLSKIQEPGAHVVLWDGLDKGGNRVPSGIYFGMLSTPRGLDQIKLVIIK